MKTKNLVVIAVGLLCATSSYALVPVSWTNLDGNNAWEDSLNWAPTTEPTNANFDVEIGLVSTAPCNLSSGFQIDALILSNSSATLNLVPGATLAFTSDVTNNGKILVNTTAAGAQTKLRFDANGALGGNGSVKLNGGGNFNYADVDIGIQTVTHGANHTIHGNGTIIGFNGGVLINNGTIIGDDSGGTFMQLDLANTANQNNATIKATNGGGLGFFGGAIDQTGGGTFLADGANSVVQFGGSNTVTVIGGTTNTANGGILLGVSTFWQGVTNNGTVQIPAGDIIVATGTGLTNNSTILVNPTATGVQTKLRFDANGALDGNGSVKLNGGGNFNYADVDIGIQTVTHGANHTIHGNGTIIGFNGGILINNGTIIGDDSGGTFMQLDLANTANQNNATIKATNGGGLGFFGGAIDQTGGGTFLADGANSVVQFGGSNTVTVIGGTTNTANGGILLGVSTFWQGVTNNGTVQIPAGDIIVATGTGLTNNSTILVNPTATGVQTKLRFDANGALDGNGSVKLNGGGNFNYADVDIGIQTVTHGANHTIHGNGTIIGFNGGVLINNGTIIGDDSGGTFMQLDLANTANQNNATIKATNGGGLGLFSGTMDQTGGGTFLADGNGSLVLLGGSSAATVIGGILNTANGGLIEANGGGVFLSGVTNNGAVQIPAGEIIVVSGTGLTNNGTILVNTTDAGVQTRLRFDADGTLGGNGSVSLNGGGGFNYAGLDCNGHSVVNGANHTIKGNGDIFVNGGTLTNNGTIAPGNSAGQLNFNGDLELGSTSNLSFEIGGTTPATQYDVLNKVDNGTLTLNGNLTVRLINGFIPANSDVFTIVTTQQILAGSFSNVANGNRLNTADGGGSFLVTYNVLNNPVASRNVTLSNFQPSANIVATPVIHPPSGPVIKKQSIQITCATPGATIYYTVNGGTPTTHSTKYKGFFVITAPATVKARAFKGAAMSAVATNTYTKGR